MNQRPFLSLCVIHRRAGNGLSRLIESIRCGGIFHFDELVFVDTGATDTDAQSQAARALLEGLEKEYPDIVRRAGYRCDEIEVDGKPCITDFSEVRNYAHDLASGTWTAFLDSDDEFVAPQWSPEQTPEEPHKPLRFSDWLAGRCSGDPAAATVLWAEYDRGEIMQPRAFCWREDVPGLEWQWVGRLHEERAVIGGRAVEAFGPVAKIIHHGDRVASGDRNMEILACLLREPDAELSPKLLLAWGAGLAERGLDGAADAFDSVIEKGRGTVAYKAMILRAELARRGGDTDAARRFLGMATVGFPWYRTAFVELGLLESRSGGDREAARAFRRAYGTRGGDHDSVSSATPSPMATSLDREEFQGRLEAALVSGRLGAYAWANEYLDGIPEDYRAHPAFGGTRLEIMRLKGDAAARSAYATLARYLLSLDEVDRAAQLLEAVPHRFGADATVNKARVLVEARVGHLANPGSYAEVYNPVRPADMEVGGPRRDAQVHAMLTAVNSLELDADVSVRVLEVGCGNGYVLSKIAEQVPVVVHAVGFDVGEGRVNVAREFHAEQVANGVLSFEVGSVEDADFVAAAGHLLQGGAHVILMAEVLEHVARSVEVLDRLRKILVPGGKLVLTVPDAERYDLIAPRARLVDLEDAAYSSHVEHVRVYDCHRLVDELEEAGFHVDEVSTTGPDEALLCAVATPLLRGPHDAVPYHGPQYHRQRQRQRLDIYAPSPLPWGPLQHEQGFSGGSEQAVEHLAPLLADRGWDVHVYASILEREFYHRGVRWHHLNRFDEAARRDTLVVWRDAEALQRFAVQGLPVAFWAHDVPKPERRAAYDSARTILALSSYHASLFKEIVSDHVRVEELGNGVAPGSLPTIPEATNEVTDDRDPRRVIYASSPGRGLLALLRMWPAIKEEESEARLDICYDMGLLRHPRTPDYLRALPDLCERLIDGELADQGVTYYEGLPQPGYLRIAARCGVWAYPTIFPEIYCIVAAEMQALGLIPVTTDRGALETTVLTGSFLPWERLADDLHLTAHQRETGLIYDLGEDANSPAFVEMVVQAMRETPTRMRGSQILANTSPYGQRPDAPQQWTATERLKLARVALATYDWARTAGAFDRALHEHSEREPCPQKSLR